MTEYLLASVSLSTLAVALPISYLAIYSFWLFFNIDFLLVVMGFVDSLSVVVRV